MSHLVPIQKAVINCGSSHPLKSCDLAVYTILLSFGLVFSFFVLFFFLVVNSGRNLKYMDLTQNYRSLVSHVPSWDWLLITSLWNILELQFYKIHVFFHLTHL